MKARVIAFYLPQFYPTLENDKWWGKGFTEWTNVGKAKPLFRGHYQPKVPADLGYYDLRVEETRLMQAEMAQKAGIEGFCYWHYWFAGKRLLNEVFDEVLASGKPDFPFCLCWANHSWFAKTWRTDVQDKLLIEQTYPGQQDYIDHFYALLPAFKDHRYIKVEDKPIFGLYAPLDIENVGDFMCLWNRLAQKEGLKGIYFWGYSMNPKLAGDILNHGFDNVVIDFIKDVFYKRSILEKVGGKMRNLFFNCPRYVNYSTYVDVFLSQYKKNANYFPCILPNFDHSPRSGRQALILADSTPDKWDYLFGNVLKILSEKKKKDNLVFIKAWNEWAEGNYLEPDLKYGTEYLDVIDKYIHQ